MAEHVEETLRAENALLRMVLLNLIRCWRNMESAPLSSNLFDTAHTQWKTAMNNGAKLLGIKSSEIETDNPNGHKYGCDCRDCMNYYQNTLKR